MVPDNHQVAYLEIEIDAAGSIGNEEIPYAYDLHYPDRQCYKLHGIALVIMNPALHCNDSLPAEFSYDEIALVAYCSGNRESRNRPVRNHDRICNLLGQLAETASEDNAHHRLPALQLTPQIFSGVLYSFCSMVHIFN